MESDIKTFAEEIKEKILARQQKRGFNNDIYHPEATYDMIVNKMKKEGWTKKND